MEFGPASDRGFFIGKFKDRGQNECSIQESSMMAEEGHIWFGMVKPDAKYFIPFKGWFELTEKQIKLALPNDAEVHLFSRMHLSKTDVATLMPALMYFVKHGALPDENFDETKQEMDGYRESVRSLRESV